MGRRSRAPATQATHPAPIRRRRHAPSASRGALGLLLCAAMVVALVPSGGMAWAAERDLEALAALAAPAAVRAAFPAAPAGALRAAADGDDAPADATPADDGDAVPTADTDADAAPVADGAAPDAAPVADEAAPDMALVPADAPADATPADDGDVGEADDGSDVTVSGADDAVLVAVVSPLAEGQVQVSERLGAMVDETKLSYSQELTPVEAAALRWRFELRYTDATGVERVGGRVEAAAGESSATLSVPARALGCAVRVVATDTSGTVSGEVASADTVAVAGHVEGEAYAAVLSAQSNGYEANTLLFLRLPSAPEDGADTLVDVCGREWRVRDFWTGFEGVAAYAYDSDVPWYEWHESIERVATAPGQLMRPANTAYWFIGLASVTEIDLAGLDLAWGDEERSTNMRYMFSRCVSLTGIDLTPLDTSKSTDMRYLFFGCSSLASIDLTPLDTSRATNIQDIFHDCSSLTSVDISSFDTTNITTIHSLFYNCTSLVSVALPDFSEGKVTRMAHVFRGCNSLTSVDLSRLNTENAIDMSYLFAGCHSLASIDATQLDTSSAQTIQYMFDNCRIITSVDVSHFDTSKATQMQGMFNNCWALTEVDVSHFDTSRSIYLNNMFSQCRALTSVDVSGWVTSKAASMQYMFNDCRVLRSVDVSHFDTSSVTSMRGMFRAMPKLESLDVSHFDTSNVTDMQEMFRGCTALSSLDVSGFRTPKVTTVAHAFRDCKSLATLDVSRWGAVSLMTLAYAFYGCEALVRLDLSGWDTSQATDMEWLVGSCKSMKVLDLGGRFSIESVESNKLPADGSFSQLTALESLNVGAWGRYNADQAHGTKRKIHLSKPSNDGKAWWYAGDDGTDKSKAGGDWYTPASEGESLLMWGSETPGLYCGYDAQEKELTIRVSAGPFGGEGYETELSATAWSVAGDDGSTSPAQGEAGTRPWEGVRAQVERVTFDPVGGKARPSSLACWFYGMSALEEVDLAGLDSARATSLSHLLDGCVSLAGLDASDLDVSSATDLSWLFAGCEGLSSLDLAGWDTSAATSMAHMFDGCSGVDRLDLSTLDTSEVTDMTGLFDGCSGVEVLEAGGRFDLGSLPSASVAPSIAALAPEGGTSSLRSAYLGAWSDYNADSAHVAKLNVAMPAHAADGCGWRDADGTARAAGVAFAPSTRSQAWLMWGTEKPGIYAKYEVANGVGTLTFRASATGQPTGDGWYPRDLSQTRWDGNGNNQPWAGIRASIVRAVFDGSNGRVRPTGMGEWFVNLSNLAEVDFSGIDTSRVLSFWSVFYNCSSLRLIDASAIDTSSATGLHTMFYGCKSLVSLDLRTWDTSNVKDMNQMFRGCSSLVSLDVSRLDTSSATNTAHMFRDCSSPYLTRLDVSGFDMRKVTDATCMFYGCNYVKELDFSRWQVPALRNMNQMLNGCHRVTKLDLSSLDTSQVTDMTSLIYNCYYIVEIDLGGRFSIEGITDEAKLPSMRNCSSANAIDLGCYTAYNAAHPGQERSIVLPAHSGTGDNKCYWDGEGMPHQRLAQVTPMTAAQGKLVWSLPYIYAGVLDGTLTVRNGGSLVPEGYYPTDLTDTSGWSDDLATSRPWQDDVASVRAVRFDASGGRVRPKSLEYWFVDLTELETVDLAGLDANGVTDMKDLFRGCSRLSSVSFAGIDTSKVVDMSGLFMGCSSLEALDGSLAALDTSKVTSMAHLFDGCVSLASIDGSIARLDTSSAEDLSYLFRGCSLLGRLAALRWDTSKVTSMACLFDGCATIEALDLSYLDTTSVTDMTSMVDGCVSLASLELGGRFSVAGVSEAERLPDLSQLSALRAVGLGAWAAWNALPANAEARRSVALPMPSGEGELWWDADGYFHASDDGVAMVTVTPATAAQARLTVGTAKAGAYARLESGTLTIMVSVGRPGNAWYAVDLLDEGGAMASAADQPWAGLRGSVASVVFDGSGGKVMPRDLAHWFEGLASATSFDLSGLDSSQATDMTRLFYGCSSLSSLDLSGVSTAAATAMGEMFGGCDDLALVTLGSGFAFRGATDGPGSVACALPVPEGDAAGRWARVADEAGHPAYDASADAYSAAGLASSYDGSLPAWRGTWEADRLVAFGGNGGTGTEARAFSPDRLVAKALAATPALYRSYCGLAGWSAEEPATTAADMVPQLPADATLADARAAATPA